MSGAKITGTADDAERSLQTMHIERYTTRHRDTFDVLMTACFTIDYAMELTAHDVRTKVCPHFLELDSRGVSPILVAVDDGDAIGLLIYQVDSHDSDWCERPGWGFIREVYVTPARRRSGVATELVRSAERILASSGVTEAYLTADDDASFWEACGWTRSGEVARNSGVILEKTLVT